MRTLLFFSLLLGAVAFAHEGDDDDDQPDAGAAPLTTTVRAARPGHTASETTVPNDVVRAAPRNGATDLLRLVPGLVASQHSGEGKAQQLFLRGFDAVHGQDVELNVGGLPVNEVSHLHALGYADLNWVIPETVREVRVTEGSPRASQGDFAVAGTVRYELGLDEPGLVFAAGIGSFNRTRLFAGFRPEGHDNTFAAVEYVRGDGFGPQRAFSRVSLLGQAVLKLDHVTLRALIGSYGSRFDSPGVVREDSLVSGTADFYGAFGAGQGGASARHQVLLAAELPHETGRTSFELYGALLDLTLRNNFTGTLATATGDGLEQRQNTGLLGVRAHHQRHLHLAGQVLLLDVGVSGRRDGIHQVQRSYREPEGQLASTAAIDAQVTQTLGSAWGELAWSPGAWRFMLGGRLDVLHVEVNDAATSRASAGKHLGLKLGVERSLGETARLFLSYGDGFRTPQARQLRDGEDAPFVNVHGGELGVRFESSRVSAAVAGFASYVGNDFFFDHTQVTTTFLGPTLRGGVQASLTARPVDGFLVSLNVTGASAQLLERRALLPYFAPLVARLDSSWSRPFSIHGVTLTPRLGIGATVLGPRPLPYGDFSRPVLLFDARAGVRVGALEVTLDLQNALDARWRDGEFVFASQWANLSRLPSRHFTAGAPRTLFLSLEVHL